MAEILEGKVALISGSARGQGASHARRLAAAGASIVVCDLLDDLGEAVARSITDVGGRAVYTHLDVRSNTDWGAAVDLAESEFGALNILVNNAGVCEISSVTECSDEEWDLVVNTNQTGVFQGMRAAIPALERAGGGSIINTASIFGLKGTWGYAAYVASKFAVIGLTKTAARTYCYSNIRVNAIAPSSVATPMLEKELKQFEGNPNFDYSKHIAMQPIPRDATVEEVSETVLYLASDMSSYTTGAVIPVDGGVLA
ncbi:SDR family oxidoreductase [Rhodococcus sp. 06-156-3C]|uniref:SDR family NAD(P)-dependent oxidoreductase n=1 Tax=Nocardiaceae TaxID=85025 RepID=UPI0005230ADF|nr:MULTISPECIES: SDR family oxidoreductase [Rhodococcus]OZD18269.1 SDR family oxidoreductase [Rhodococcus sp. 06-156-4C]OZD18867.1 SDR family oxidoreductase [Rhodococcus sp. 06-156-3C]OZD22377.1 SDR family oxidoreductase [Rhodococcus sp. 06-156-4a]OZD33961.1 SDR family oxidoreductase [Rhodococcus sp. 06-156-3b]OZD38698.1 SDR family oxidoreductase [Rhodococcus sp. 06-156-3]